MVKVAQYIEIREQFRVQLNGRLINIFTDIIGTKDFNGLGQQHCHARYTCSDSNTEVKQHWARAVLRWEQLGNSWCCSHRFDAGLIQWQIQALLTGDGCIMLVRISDRVSPSSATNTNGDKKFSFGLEKWYNLFVSRPPGLYQLHRTLARFFSNYGITKVQSV